MFVIHRTIVVEICFYTIQNHNDKLFKSKLLLDDSHPRALKGLNINFPLHAILARIKLLHSDLFQSIFQLIHSWSPSLKHFYFVQVETLMSYLSESRLFYFLL